MRLTCGEVAGELDLPQADARQLVADFERGLGLYEARKLARGQPISDGGHDYPRRGERNSEDRDFLCLLIRAE